MSPLFGCAAACRYLGFGFLSMLVCAVFGLAQDTRVLPSSMLKIYADFSNRTSPHERTSNLTIQPKIRTLSSGDTDPAFQDLLVAYNALREEDFDRAIQYFNKAIVISPQRTDIRKDLAYTYFKVGTNEPARQQFLKVMELDPTDYHSALEVAFLTYEIDDSGNRAEALRMFDQIRKTGDPESKATAEQAFQNVDGALAIQIAALEEALKFDPENLGLHYRLGWIAEERNDFDLSIKNYKAAVGPNRNSVYIGLARVLTLAGRIAEARDALDQAIQLSASDPFTAEQAKDMLAKLAGK